MASRCTASPASGCKFHHLRNPSTRRRIASQGRVMRRCCARFRGTVSAGRRGPTLAPKVCMFTNSPDEHFIVDQHPNSPGDPAAGFGTVLSSAASSGRSWPTWRFRRKPARYAPLSPGAPWAGISAVTYHSERVDPEPLLAARVKRRISRAERDSSLEPCREALCVVDPLRVTARSAPPSGTPALGVILFPRAKKLCYHIILI
jgi:hypothetical protein